MALASPRVGSGMLDRVATPRVGSGMLDRVATPRVGSGMLERARVLTDVGSMTRLLHEIVAYERSIDEELEGLLSQRSELDKKLGSIHRSGEVLEVVHADAEEMLASVQATCDLADLVSGKVRELDRAQSRVQETLGRIDAILDRGSCLDGARQALAAEDYEAAARYVEKFLQLDQKMGLAADSVGDQKAQLLESKRKLEDVVRRKMSAAVESRDHSSVVRFASLYAPLGMHDEGLKSFVGYLKKAVGLKAKDAFEGLMKNLEKADFVEVTNSLFKDIAESIESNEELIRNLGGEDGIVFAVKGLQEECDSRGSVLLKKYVEHRNLDKLEKEIVSHNKVVLSVAPPEGPEPRSIEIHLEEMLLLLRTSEDYLQFMIARLREAASAGGQLSPRATTSFRTGSFSRAVQELTNFYLVFEEYFLIENVKKAIKLDEFAAGELTTSVVDDVFYVLQSCTRRAISTLNLHLVLSLVNCVANVLNNEYKDALQRKMREPNLALKLFAGGTGVFKVGTEVSAALNNMDVSAEYVLKLKQEIEEECSEVFPTAAEREKLKSCLVELGGASLSLRQVAVAGLEQLSNCIVPRLRTFLDSVSSISYEISEAQYAENELNDPWVQKLLHAVESNASWLQPLLTTSNYDSLVHLLVDFIVRRLEAIMSQKHFNQLGGLQLDKDVRTLVGHFSAMTRRTVRDKFARLAQMATILNLEKVSEILDYWGENSGPMTWRLTPAEVRRILSLRVDFKPEAIDALKL